MSKNEAQGATPPSKVPYYDLGEVQRLARTSRPQPLFNDRKSTDIVADRRSVPLDDAKVFMLEAIAGLTVANFSDTLVEKLPPADVYGVSIERVGWYVKLSISKNRLVVISFHPPERRLKTQGFGWIDAEM